MPRATDQNGPKFLWAILILCCGVAANAQDPPSKLPAPPPMKFVSRVERSQLTATHDSKSRLKLTIELAESHLAQAEEFTTQKKYDSAAEEVGAYLGLIDDAYGYIAGMNSDKDSTRDLYRRLDLRLRTHLPRLAVMRRTTPVEYAVNIKAAEDHTRDTRSDALDSFYGHTVLRDTANQKKSDKPNELETNKRP
jgi:hypothetical protein